MKGRRMGIGEWVRWAVAGLGCPDTTNAIDPDSPVIFALPRPIIRKGTIEAGTTLDYYCELSREQLEAALNFLQHVQNERAKGRTIDVSRLRHITVRRDVSNKAGVTFEIEYEDRLKAA